MKESALQSKVIVYLNSIGAYVMNNIGNAKSGSGRPDITGCYKGYFFGIELKVPGQESSGLTHIQAANLRAIQRAGGYACVASSLEQVEHFIGTIF